MLRSVNRRLRIRQSSSTSSSSFSPVLSSRATTDSKKELVAQFTVWHQNEKSLYQQQAWLRPSQQLNAACFFSTTASSTSNELDRTTTAPSLPSTSTDTNTNTETDTTSTNTKTDPTMAKRGNSSKGHGNKQKHGTKKQKKETHHNFTRGGTRKFEGVHPGSYAHPEMRQLFGVELPNYKDPQQHQQQNNTNNNDQAQQVGEEQPSSASTNTTVATNSQQDKPPASASAEASKTPEESSAPKRAKRKVAFLIAYLGTNYTGFQINQNQKTLQAEIELALYRAGFLADTNFGYPHKYSWSTSGRTDKGVHACAQVCSAKIELASADQTMTDVIDQINAVLPSDIRILDVNRVARSFCAKTERDQVRYQYMIPSFALTDSATMRKLFEDVGCTNDRPPGDPLLPKEREAIQHQLNSTRITPAQLDTLRQALQAFVGTKSHHNYSKGVGNDEARSNRYIISWTMEDPIIFENGTEWIPTQVLGQSFLLHQIRKMSGRAMDVVRGAVTMEVLEKGFDRTVTYNVPPAPAQGLYLEMSYYKGYNNRKARKQVEAPDLDWTKEDSVVHQRWHHFRNNVLMKHLVKQEEQEGNFLKYMYQQEYVNCDAERGTGLFVESDREENDCDE